MQFNQFFNPFFILIRVTSNMCNHNFQPFNFNVFNLFCTGNYSKIINIPIYGNCFLECLKFVQDLFTSNVSGVYNKVNIFKKLINLLRQIAMRIGQNTNFLHINSFCKDNILRDILLFAFFFGYLQTKVLLFHVEEFQSLYSHFLLNALLGYEFHLD